MIRSFLGSLYRFVYIFEMILTQRNDRWFCCALFQEVPLPLITVRRATWTTGRLGTSFLSICINTTLIETLDLLFICIKIFPNTTS